MKRPQNKIAIIIPAFNEVETIRTVVQEVRSAAAKTGAHFEIIVVNDGSVDGTAEVVQDLPCLLLNLPINIGIGGAMQLGFRHAHARDSTVAVQVDADGQHPASEIVKLLAPLRDDQADVVIGSRFLKGGGSRSTFGRRIGIRYLNFLQGLLIGRRITDSTSGFRAMNRRALAICVNQYPDQFPEPVVTIMLARRGLRILEVPVHMNERRGGRSSIGFFGSMLYAFKVSMAMLIAAIQTRH
jgi:glycosyltransferase involved in cell wall biosynthesis